MKYDYLNHRLNIVEKNRLTLVKTGSMFEYENLPETIPYYELEKLLQQNGFAFITEYNGELYAFNGGLGGVPDVYNNPTEIIISNPALRLNKTFNIKTDGVLIKNDDEKLGLKILINRFNTLIEEAETNLVLAGYNSRISKIISAPDDKTKASAEQYINRIKNGDLGIIGENALFDGVRVQGSNGQNNPITELIEYQQFLQGSLYNELGLNANINLKRERLTAGETEQNDNIYPLINNMMKCRIKGLEELNAKYNLNVLIDYGSVWARNDKEVVDGVVEDFELLETLEVDIAALEETETEEAETEETETEEEAEAEAEEEAEEEAETEETEAETEKEEKE